MSTEARSLGARAFTRGGEVFLPAEAGPLDTPNARGLLAHELVHAVQQRTLGPALPAAHTPAGMALEAEAVAAEREHVPHPEPPPTPRTDHAEGVQLAEYDAIRTLEEWTAPTPEEEAAESIVDIPDEQELPALGRSQQDQQMAEQILQVINVEREQSGEPELTTLDSNAMALVRRMIAEQAESTTARSVIFAQAAATGVERAEPLPAPPAEPAVAPPQQPLPQVVAPEPPPPTPAYAPTDPNDQPIEVERLDLEQLTARLYDRLRTRIRMELLIDRERAGLLTDFR